MHPNHPAIEQHHRRVPRRCQRGRVGRHERAGVLREATRQLVGRRRIAVIASDQGIDIAFELGILGPQHQRAPQVDQRLVDPPQAAEQLAERDLRRGLIRQPPRQRREPRQRPVGLPGPLVEPRQLDGQRRQIGAQRRRGHETGAGLPGVAPIARPRGELVQKVDLDPALARERRQQAIAGASTTRRLVEAGRRPADPRQRLHRRRQGFESRQRRHRQRRLGLLVGERQGRRPAAGIERERAAKRLRRPRLSPFGPGQLPEPRQQQRAPGRGDRQLSRPFEIAPSFVVVVGDLGRHQVAAQRRPRGQRALRGVRGSVGVAVPRGDPGQRARQIEPGIGRRLAARRLRAQRQQPVERNDRDLPPGSRCRRRLRPLGVPRRELRLAAEVQRRTGRIGQPGVEPPGTVDDDRLDEDPIPPASQPDRGRVLIEHRGPDHVLGEHQRAVDPDLDRSRRTDAQRRRTVAIAVDEGRHVSDRLVVGTQEAVEVKRPFADGGVPRPPSDVVDLSGIPARAAGELRCRLGFRRERRPEAGAPLSERTDHERVGEKTETAPQRGGLLGRAALVAQVRQQERRLRGDQRMRPGADPAADRRLQRRRRHGLIELRQLRQRGDRFRLAGLRAEPRTSPRQHFVVRTRGLRRCRRVGPGATDAGHDDAKHQRRRCPILHHGPARL